MISVRAGSCWDAHRTELNVGTTYRAVAAKAPVAPTVAARLLTTMKLDDGRLEISNNAAEKQIRPATLGRKKLVVLGLGRRRSALPGSTRSCEPPASTALSPRPGSPTSSPASAAIRSTGSPSCCPGTGRHRRRRASPPDPVSVKRNERQSQPLAYTAVHVTKKWSALEVGGEDGLEKVQQHEATATQGAQVVLVDVRERAQQAEVQCETVHVADAEPAEGIMRTAQSRGCDLIVMGTHGRGGLDRLLLGSQAENVLTHSTFHMIICR
jgi:nucleotide-binding universal stress UspA family protein